MNSDELAGQSWAGYVERYMYGNGYQDSEQASNDDQSSVERLRLVWASDTNE